jgi:hypothetical protein
MVRRGGGTREERAARRAAERAATSAELERVRLAIAQQAEARRTGDSAGTNPGKAASRGAGRLGGRNAGQGTDEKPMTREEAWQDLLSQWITFRVSRRQRHAIRCLEARRPKFKVTRFLRKKLLELLRREGLLTADQVEAPGARAKPADGFRQRDLFGLDGEDVSPEE